MKRSNATELSQERDALRAQIQSSRQQIQGIAEQRDTLAGFLAPKKHNLREILMFRPCRGIGIGRLDAQKVLDHLAALRRYPTASHHPLEQITAPAHQQIRERRRPPR